MRFIKLLSKIALITISLTLIGCSTDSKEGGTPVLFNTRTEAVEAAKNLNCKGAHKMGDKWMPCRSHKAHEKHQNHKGSHHNH